MQQQQQQFNNVMSDFSKCEGGPCPIKDDCTRFTAPSQQETMWQPFFLIIPYNQQTNSCEMKVSHV